MMESSPGRDVEILEFEATSGCYLDEDGSNCISDNQLENGNPQDSSVVPPFISFSDIQSENGNLQNASVVPPFIQVIHSEDHEGDAPLNLMKISKNNDTANLDHTMTLDINSMDTEPETSMFTKPETDTLSGNGVDGQAHETSGVMIDPLFNVADYEASPFTGKIKRKYNRTKPKMDLLCRECGNLYSNSTCLKRHIASVHENKRPYACNQCDQSFKQSAHLVSHMAVVHQERELPYGCDMCDKKFLIKSKLDTHRSMVHMQVKRYGCKQCEMKFFNNAKLRSHVSEVHKKEKPNPCELCERKFFSKFQLNRHVSQVHLKERPYLCLICNTSFQEKARLKKHIASKHEDGKNVVGFSCFHCGSSFENSKDLTNHVLNSHEFALPPNWGSTNDNDETTNETGLFSCIHCPREFHNSKDLTDHVLSNHESKMSPFSGIASESLVAPSVVAQNMAQFFGMTQDNDGASNVNPSLPLFPKIKEEHDAEPLDLAQCPLISQGQATNEENLNLKDEKQSNDDLISKSEQQSNKEENS